MKEGLEFYNQRRKTDKFTPDGTLVCPQGIVCAFAQWLEYKPLKADLELPVDGTKACQY